MVDRDETQIDAGSIQGGSKKEHQRPVTLLLRVEEKVSRALSKKVGLSELDSRCTEQLESTSHQGPFDNDSRRSDSKNHRGQLTGECTHSTYFGPSFPT